MKITLNDYKNKVLGCWMGKNIGGTLGAPFEWLRQINDVTFYQQDLGGDPLPNDDLDIQLIWLIAMEEKGVDIDAKLLGEYWMLLVTPHWAEYGNAKLNMRSGLVPPLSGSYSNVYKDSCGAFIRSEIWACVAPGYPALAAKFAFEDAIIDHGDGEGVYAEIFCAALESAAFIESDIQSLIDIGLSYIPADCAIAGAVSLVRDLYANGKSWKEARDEVLRQYRGLGLKVSPEDVEKGFADGQMGWDAPSNIGMLIIGMLYGEGDFSRSLRIIVNCGEDTDCTAATYGAIYGIVNGLDAIPAEWQKPIGRKIKTACLNLGELGGYGSQLPQDIDELTDRTAKMMQQVFLRNRLPLVVDEGEMIIGDGDMSRSLYAPEGFNRIYDNMRGPVYRFGSFDVRVEYPDGPVIKNNIPTRVRVVVINKGKTHEMYYLRWISPDGFQILPGLESTAYIPLPLGSASGENMMDFTVSTETVPRPVNRFALELTCQNKGSTMLIPVVLLNTTVEALPIPK
ncbi:MAG TPA: ADP-ribosylglycohydrolase family protein [Clostridiales bacterium]|nr:ADP-ribosylglycohydrolase family protein [Clostridiales bacterium]